MTAPEFTCDACLKTFEKITPDEDALAEAHAVFRPEELVDAAYLCDDCWRLMRESVPDVDARYREFNL